MPARKLALLFGGGAAVVVAGFALGLAVGNFSTEGRASDEREEFTLEQHEDAVHRTLACISDAGIEAEAVEATGLRPSQLTYRVPSEADIPAAEATIADCRKLAGLDDIEIARALQQAALPREAKEEAFTLVVECMERRGAPVPEGTIITLEYIGGLGRPGSGAQESIIIHEFGVCVDEVEAATGVRP